MTFAIAFDVYGTLTDTGADADAALEQLKGSGWQAAWVKRPDNAVFDPWG